MSISNNKVYGQHKLCHSKNLPFLEFTESHIFLRSKHVKMSVKMGFYLIKGMKSLESKWSLNRNCSGQMKH